MDKRTKHIPALEGLRGIAILMVMGFHYFPGIRLFSIGWTGVDLFFVLSGYLITNRLLATMHEPDYFKNFYRNRILRIFPLYYLVLMVFFAAILLFAKKENLDLLSFYIVHWKSFFLFTENWTFIWYGLPHDAYLAHFWSLAIEEQFYLFWPFVVLWITPMNARLKIWTIAILCVVGLRTLIFANQLVIGNFPSYYNNTFCRIDSLMIGAVLGEMHFQKIRFSNKWIKSLLVFISIALSAGIYISGNAKLNSTFMATIGYTCFAIFYACIIHFAVRSKSLFADLLNLTLLKFTGKISYGLYVFHWPVFLILGTRIKNWGFAHFPHYIISVELTAAFLSILISFGISNLSFRYFESFFLKYKLK